MLEAAISADVEGRLEAEEKDEEEESSSLSSVGTRREAGDNGEAEEEELSLVWEGDTAPRKAGTAPETPSCTVFM